MTRETAEATGTPDRDTFERWLARATIEAGAWPHEEERDSVTLTFDERYRRRAVLTTDRGRAVLLDLPAAVPLAEGDALVLDGGGFVRVIAAPEPVADLRCEDAHRQLQLAWHLGNRHLAVEVRPGVLRIRRDHVIEEMARQRGATILHLDAPFQPEGGAYAGAHREHGHGDG